MVREPQERGCRQAVGLRLAATVSLLLLIGSSCGGGDAPVRQEDVELRHEVEYIDGYEATVAVDSVAWQLGRLNDTIPDDVEIEGVFRFCLQNLRQESTSSRHELRFFDEDDQLVDVYFPFGQPVELAPAESRRMEGGFVISFGYIEDLRFIRTMRVVVKLAD